MPDVNITISTPPLQVSETFKVKYRLLPNGAFSVEQLETNATFTLVGLAVGDYELSVILDKGDTDCPEVLRRFSVVEPFECIEFAGAEIIAQSNGTYMLQITYGAVGTPPPCGWDIFISGATNNKIIHYATLPASPLLIPINNQPLSVSITADLCNSEKENCFAADVPSIPVPCEPMVIGSVNIVWLNDPNNINRFAVTFNITQSTPYTSFAQVNVLQTNTLVGGTGPAGQVSYASSNPLPLGINQIAFTVLIDVNPNIGGVDIYTFSWFVVDRCNVKHTGTIFIAVP